MDGTMKIASAVDVLEYPFIAAFASLHGGATLKLIEDAKSEGAPADSVGFIGGSWVRIGQLDRKEIRRLIPHLPPEFVIRSLGIESG